MRSPSLVTPTLKLLLTVTLEWRDTPGGRAIYIWTQEGIELKILAQDEQLQQQQQQQQQQQELILQSWNMASDSFFERGMSRKVTELKVGETETRDQFHHHYLWAAFALVDLC